MADSVPPETRELVHLPSQTIMRPVVSVQELVQAHKEATEIIKHALQNGIDYGVIPGTGDKPVLLKPGAERLLLAFGAYASYEILEQECDHECELSYFKRKKVWRNEYQGDKRFTTMDEQGSSLGFYRYVIKASIITRSNGEIVGTGIGACSTVESKYIDRPRDCENTVLKMAQKRCLGSTVSVLIKTSRGVLRTTVGKLAQIFDKASEPVYVPAVDGKSWRRIEAMEKSDRRVVCRINLSDGSYLRATTEHRFPTDRGLVTVSDLRPGDRLLRSDINLGESGKADPEIAFMVGLFIAEGHYADEGRCGLRFTINGQRDDLVGRIVELAERLGSTVSTRKRESDCYIVEVHGSAFVGVIQQFVDGEGSGGKHLSRYCWRQGASFLQSLLDGYLAGDGSYTSRPGRKPFWTLGFTAKNADLADDLRCLANVMGVRLSLKRGDARLNGVSFPTYVGWIKPAEKTYNQKDLSEIVSVEAEPKPGTVYDIQVDGDHLFCLANGIQTHNSMVAAVLNTFGLSGRFTQDVDDIEIEEIPPAPAAAGATSGNTHGVDMATPAQKGLLRSLYQKAGEKVPNVDLITRVQAQQEIARLKGGAKPAAATPAAAAEPAQEPAQAATGKRAKPRTPAEAAAAIRKLPSAAAVDPEELEQEIEKCLAAPDDYHRLQMLTALALDIKEGHYSQTSSAAATEEVVTDPFTDPFPEEETAVAPEPAGAEA